MTLRSVLTQSNAGQPGKTVYVRPKTTRRCSRQTIHHTVSLQNLHQKILYSIRIVIINFI